MPGIDHVTDMRALAEAHKLTWTPGGPGKPHRVTDADGELVAEEMDLRRLVHDIEERYGPAA